MQRFPPGSFNDRPIRAILSWKQLPELVPPACSDLDNIRPAVYFGRPERYPPERKKPIARTQNNTDSSSRNESGKASGPAHEIPKRGFSFTCKHCDISLSNKSSLARHRRSARHLSLSGSGTSTSNFLCTLCQKNFSRRYGLRRHFQERHCNVKRATKTGSSPSTSTTTNTSAISLDPPSRPEPAKVQAVEQASTLDSFSHFPVAAPPAWQLNGLNWDTLFADCNQDAFETKSGILDYAEQDEAASRGSILPPEGLLGLDNACAASTGTAYDNQPSFGNPELGTNNDYPISDNHFDWDPAGWNFEDTFSSMV